MNNKNKTVVRMSLVEAIEKRFNIINSSDDIGSYLDFLKVLIIVPFIFFCLIPFIYLFGGMVYLLSQFDNAIFTVGFMLSATYVFYFWYFKKWRV